MTLPEAPHERNQMATATLPPGPRGIRTISAGLEFVQDPLNYLTRCAREYGDVVRLRFLHVPIFILSHPDDIEEVLVTQNANFIKSMDLRESRGVLGDGLLTSEGDFWRRQRRLIQPAFHRERIAGYARIMTSYAEQMMTAWKPGETRDVHADMMRLTLEIVARALFDTGVAEDVEAFGEALDALLKQYVTRSNTAFLLSANFPTPGNLRTRRAVGRLNEVLYRILRERRADSHDHGDLLSMMLAARDDDGNPMTDGQLRDEMITLLFAGHETTAIALSWTWYVLGQNLDVAAKLHAELDATLAGRTPTMEDLPKLSYAEKVVRESMRLYPPAWAIGREAVRDCVIGGYHMPAGTTVYMNQWVVHRDERFYDQPERFDPDRWTAEFSKRLPRFAYFPFGGGPRVCIGAAFAQMEAVILLATIAQRFELRLDPAHRVTPWPTVTLRPANGVRVTLKQRVWAAGMGA